MHDHQPGAANHRRPLKSAILDAAGAVSLFILLFGVLHLPIMT